MLSIHTKFVPATSQRSARIKAYSYDKRQVIIPIDYSLGDVERHHKAVKAFIERHLSLPDDFDGSKMVYGSGHDNKGYVFCFPQSTIEG